VGVSGPALCSQARCSLPRSLERQLPEAIDRDVSGFTFVLDAEVSVKTLVIAASLTALIWGTSSAAIKVGGAEFVPKDVVFSPADARSRATGDGNLPDRCKWELSTETRVGQKSDDRNCASYFYRTRVVLSSTCPPPAKQDLEPRATERITKQGPFCPDGGAKVPLPALDAHAVSTGRTPEGKQQDILSQPDGTRITITSDASSVQVVVVYPDGTADVLKVP
jgi:hypothetical protein